MNCKYSILFRYKNSIMAIQYMTQDGYDKLKKELADALAMRPVISAQIAEAREKGDLSENADYDAAKDEQRDVEARIEELEQLLKNVEVVDVEQVDGKVAKVGFGCTVKVEDVEMKETMELTIKGASEADSLNGSISNESPLGLALIGAVRGYKTIIIMPDSVSEERRKLVQHYGAEVMLVHDAGNIGDCIDECLQTALRLKAENPNVYVPQQFENYANPLAHKYFTGLEILEQTGREIHGFCSGIGTGGTISGIGEVLKALYPNIEIWAVEPENAAILAGGNIGTPLQMGIGDGLIPDNLNMDIYSEIYIVTDEEAIQTAKDLARLEGIMCGISSGTNVAAALKMAEKLGEGKTVVTVLPDTAERYFSTPLFD